MSLLTPDRRIRTSVFEEGDEMREEETRGLTPERFLFPIVASAVFQQWIDLFFEAPNRQPLEGLGSGVR